MKSRIVVLECENEQLKRKLGAEDNSDMQHRATAKLVKRLQSEVKHLTKINRAQEDKISNKDFATTTKHHHSVQTARSTSKTKRKLSRQQS